jgi:hypothetical protein
MADFKETYTKHVQEEFQRAKLEYDQILEAFKEAERRLIGTQYALQTVLNFNREE